MNTADPLGLAVRLGTAVDTLAALAAHLRLQTEGLEADERTRSLLAEIVAEAVGGEPAGGLGAAAAGPSAAPVIGLARTFLVQGLDLVDDPGRSGGWDGMNPGLLQSIGRLSIGVGEAILAAERVIPALRERLAAPGARFLDVGTGTGWLAIAVARSHPTLTVTGIDLLESPLTLARSNLAASGLGDRIALDRMDVLELPSEPAYDAIWLPMPFLPAQIVPGAVRAAAAALKPGGWLVPGTFAGAPGRLGQLLTELRTVRCGGHPWTPEQVIDLLGDAGLSDVQAIARNWSAPVLLCAGKRSGPATATG